ncbi:hypothetical protein QJQ45_028057 [Haematococcus lacustris]|nr:hypothetical protein QJQ45_028057 [Haematococcus lacustris]
MLSRTTVRAGSSSTWPCQAGLCQPSFRRRAHIVGHRRAGNDPTFSREREITCGASLLEAAPQCTEVQRCSASQPSQLLGGWLVQGVETIVKYLANSRQQSLLLLVHSGRRGQPVFSTQPLTNDQAAAANWPHVANQVLATGASALVLVRPILSPKAACPFTATDTSGSATNSPECSLYSDCQLTSHTQASSADLQGHVDVGGCCAQAATQPPPDLMQQAAQQLMRSGSSDSSDSSSSSSSSEEEGKAPADLLGSTAPEMPRSRRRFQRRQQQAAAATSIIATYAQSTGSARSTPSHIVSHYGLVVQSLVEGHHSLQPPGLGQRALPSHDGCYVLKTTQNSVPGGCSCTLFSLTHVCWGQPLYQQLRNAWLAP